MTGRVAVSYRPGEERDRAETLDVMRRASGDLHVAHGDPRPAGPEPARAIAFRSHALAVDPAGFWVAEARGRIAGFGIATVRGSAWYLAALHVLPEFQGYGIGRELLTRCLRTAPDGGLLLILSEALNEVSNGLYMRFGTVPRQALLTITGPATADTAGALTHAPLDDTPATASLVDEIDRDAAGMARRADHLFWAGLADLTPFALSAAGQLAGYAYITADGVVGPAAFTAAADPAAAGAAVIECARELGAGSVRLRIFGPARGLIEYLLGAGFRLEPGIGLLLATEPFGHLDRYLVSSDALF
jgi:GNAT superfamily N-acetyltransferase